MSTTRALPVVTDEALEAVSFATMPARILVVENDPASLELFRVLVEAWGHELIPARHGEQALEILSRETPDLIVSDLQLSVRHKSLSGYAVAEWCRKEARLATVPILCCTATMRWYDPDKVKTAGFTTVIPKPILPETFMYQLEFYLPPDKRGNPPTPR